MNDFGEVLPARRGLFFWRALGRELSALVLWLAGAGGAEKLMREVVRMPNEKNLKPLNERTKEEQRKIQSDGGKASGAARRRKRSLKEAADLYLSLPVSDRRAWNKIAKSGVSPEDIDNQMAMIVGLTSAAMMGDAKAAKVIVNLIGEDTKASDEGVQIVDDVPAGES